MKFRLIGFALISALLLAGCQAKNIGESDLDTLSSKASYAIGHNLGSNFKQQFEDIELTILLQGIKDGLQDDVSLLTPEEFETTMMTFQEEMTEKQTAKRNTMAENNLTEGQAYLAENRKEDGVTVLPSGLQYEVLQAGSGASPKATDTVTTHYAGTLIDGTEFDSSIKRGEPATFPVGGVIPGWVEALQLMKAGDKWRLVLPPDLAYGENGAGEIIGPNAVLIFEVELLSIEE